MVELFAIIGDPGQTPHSVASGLGLYCLPVTRWVSRVFNSAEVNCLLVFYSYLSGRQQRVVRPNKNRTYIYIHIYTYIYIYIYIYIYSA